jgi:hypothetical protein
MAAALANIAISGAVAFLTCVPSQIFGTLRSVPFGVGGFVSTPKYTSSVKLFGSVLAARTWPPRLRY